MFKCVRMLFVYCTSLMGVYGTQENLFVRVYLHSSLETHQTGVREVNKHINKTNGQIVAVFYLYIFLH